MRRVTAVFLAAVLLLLIVACGESPSATAQTINITIAQLTGTARTLRADGLAEALAVGSEIFLGDSVITDRDSTVNLDVDSIDTSITVSPSSEIVFSTVSNDDGDVSIIITVRKGSISNSVDVSLDAGDIYEVCTGDLTMAIRGTDAYVERSEDETAIALLTGYAYVFNYYDGVTYEVPAGVCGYFYTDAQPDFELFDTESFSEFSEAAATMLAKVENESPDYADAFESTLRDSYAIDPEYEFNWTEGYDPSALIAEEPVALGSEQTTTSEDVTETTTTATTVESTRATTTTVTAATATAATTTTSTTTTTATATTTAEAPTTSEATTTTTASTTTTTTTTSSASQYTVQFTGLYYADDTGNWIAITEDVVYSFIPEEGVYTPVELTYEGNTFSFSFTWNEASAGNYTAEAQNRLYASSYPSDLYNNVSTIVIATLTEA